MVSKGFDSPEQALAVSLLQELFDRVEHELRNTLRAERHGLKVSPRPNAEVTLAQLRELKEMLDREELTWKFVANVIVLAGQFPRPQTKKRIIGTVQQQKAKKRRASALEDLLKQILSKAPSISTKECLKLLEAKAPSHPDLLEMRDGTLYYEYKRTKNRRTMKPLTVNLLGPKLSRLRR